MPDTTLTDARQTWVNWRAERERTLAEPHGWLSPTALHWLQPQPEALPGLPGTWRSDRATVHVALPPEQSLLVDGQPVSGEVTLWQPGAPAPRVEYGPLLLELLVRDGSAAVRVRDPQAPTRTSFRGVPTYGYTPDWVVPATFRPAPTEARILIDSIIIGQRQDRALLGQVLFTKDGADVALTLVGSSTGPTLLFRDRTTGVTTYGALRSLSVPVPQDVLAGGGDVTLDFNRAVNSPCAFTEFCTCPLPPAGNDIPLPVEAGEQAPPRP
jgi:uncharacterized protein (DUF1684 family)